MEPLPRLKSITGVARALLATVGPHDAVEILVSQFGWDVSFRALADVDAAEGQAAMWLAVQQLHCDDRAA